MSKQSTSVQVGPGTAGLLTILFVILKVTNYIAWSWWWVFSPLWISAGITLLIILLLAAAAAILAFLK